MSDATEATEAIRERIREAVYGSLVQHELGEEVSRILEAIYERFEADLPEKQHALRRALARALDG